MESAKRRTWADLVVLIVSLWTVGQAIWGPALIQQAARDTGTSANWILALVCGGLAIAGMVIAQKRVGLGQGLVAAAGALLLIGPFTWQRLPPLPMTFAIVSGLLLIVAAKFVGPVPSPRET